MQTPRVLKVSEAAAVLGLPGPWTLRRLEQRGVIPRPHRTPVTGVRYYTLTDVPRIRQRIEESKKTCQP